MTKRSACLLLAILLTGCQTTQSRGKDQRSVALDIKFNSREIVVGSYCRAEISLANQTGDPIWCFVPTIQLPKKPAGFQRPGRHISVMMETYLQEGLACSLHFKGKVPARMGGAIRGAQGGGWAELAPGESRTSVVYFDGNTLRTERQKNRVWGTMGTYVVSVSTQYRTKKDDEATQERVVSPDVKITVVKK